MPWPFRRKGPANPESSSLQIVNVLLFFSPLGPLQDDVAAGRVVVRGVAPRELVPKADAKMGLDGALVSWVAERSPSFEQIPYMEREQLSELLRTRADYANRIEVYRAKTPDTYYTVVVEIRP